MGRTGGRSPKLTEDDLGVARTLLANPDITVADVADRIGLSPTALYQYLAAARTTHAATMIPREFALSLCSNNRGNTTRLARQVEDLDDARHELAGNDAVFEAARRDAGARPQIDPRPDETVEFGDDYPRALVIKPKVSFQSGGQLDGAARIRRRRVRNREHRDDHLAFDGARGGNDGAGPVFDPFFGSRDMLAGP
jgi:hypothetical protein